MSTKELVFLNYGTEEDSWKSLDCKEIQPVHPKGNQWTKLIHWKDWCWSWITNTLATWWEETTHWKRSQCWERFSAGREGGDRGWDGWMVSLTQWTWVWQTLGDSEGQGSLACSGSWSCKELDMAEQLNWSELNWVGCSPWGHTESDTTDWLSSSSSGSINSLLKTAQKPQPEKKKKNQDSP